MIDIKNLLNDKQYEAATSNSKYLRIIAGAGSGKTRVLTYRIVHLIENLGYYPSSILAITFTNKAAEEIKTRIKKALKNDSIFLRVNTFHSFCSNVLRQECKAIGYPSNFTILDEDDQKKIIKDIIKQEELDEKFLKLSSLIDYIASKKNGHVSPDENYRHESNNYYGHQRAIVYQKYEEKLRKDFAMDFDDLILKTIDIFQQYDVIKEKWQNKLNHILVDEFQDTDDNQYLLLKLLAGSKSEITVVGDPDQTIYTWRGANISIILNFDRDFEGAKTVSLEQNYRSTGKILEVANRLIEHNVNRIKKNLFTNEEAGAEISQYQGENEQQEADFVVNNILDLYDGEKVKLRDFAILYRTNAQSAALEQSLMAHKLKYKIYGGIRFYRRMEIKDCIAFLRLALNYNDSLSCERLLENTGKGIGKSTIEKIKANASTEDKSVFIHLKDEYDNLTSLYKPKQGGSLKAFVDAMNLLHDSFVLEPEKARKTFDDFLHDKGYFDMLISLEMEDKIDNVKQFLKQMDDYLKEEGHTLDEFVQNVTLMSAQDEIEDDNEDYVKLMTIHTAKGLEFDNVFIFGLVDLIFPSSRTIEEKQDGLEEERRLFYVAITRAKKRLFLSTSGGYSYMGNRTPSRFLKEINVVAKEHNVDIKKGMFIDNSAKAKIRAGSIINHDTFGEGIVISEKDGIIDVAFKDPSVGRKKLNAFHKAIHLIR